MMPSIATTARNLLLLATCLGLSSCETLEEFASSVSPKPAATAPEKPVEPEKPALPELSGESFTGTVSWYSVKTNGGTRTASGIPFTDHGHTAAHPSLPFGTLVKVTNLNNDESTVLKITDRGPFHKGRVLDVAIGAARDLGFAQQGLAKCRIDVLKAPLPDQKIATGPIRKEEAESPGDEPAPEPVSVAVASTGDPGETSVSETDRSEGVRDTPDRESESGVLLLPLKELFTKGRPAS